MAKLEPVSGYYYLWEYVPSMAASIIFLTLFFAPTLFHVWMAWKTHALFCIPFIIGGVFEVIGYAFRAACTNATANLILYILQSVFILLGPVLLAASVYMVLARLIRSVGAEKYSLVRITWLTKTFVTGDIVSFLVQGQGSGLMATDGLENIAKGIVICGLVIQIFVFGFFIVTCMVFEKRMKRAPTSEVPYTHHLYPLYAVSWLIMVRSIFRVLEYAMGQKGYLLVNEWPLFVFDAVPMVSVMVIWGYWHPGSIQQESTLRLD
ncbi:RTA1 domain-containing protein [Aspergillus homomorphus CBS 101889]|uniref:RTA1 like protein n=1 Tax=Aspergillus homomorphus (strain CBS 101889) TaxID=1450537 RepID=A0A395IBK3_ASPHC|nr:RTA1 like protein [Aspergillus homomorphus CBS 101889]RAL17610.1 RTA1 like protein [Aspergillus homomorphus CBS 101889]